MGAEDRGWVVARPRRRRAGSSWQVAAGRRERKAWIGELADPWMGKKNVREGQGGGGAREERSMAGAMSTAELSSVPSDR